MKRLAIALLLSLLAVPAFAQAPPAIKWTRADKEYVVQAYFVSGAGRHTIEADAAYMNVVTADPATGRGSEWGVASNIFRTGGSGSVGIGPRYEYNLSNLRYGNVFIGGDGLYTGLGNTGADFAAIARVGYKYHLGKSSAFRVEFNVQQDVGAGNSGTLSRVSIGYSFAAKKAATP